MIRLFNVSIPTSVVGLILTETLLLALCYSFAATLALDPITDPAFYLRYEYGWLQILIVVFVLQTGLYLMDLYDDLHLRSRIFLVQQLCILLGAAFLVQALMGYAEWTVLQLPQWTMVYGSVLTIILVPLWRITFLALIRKALPAQKLLFLGTSPIVLELVQHFTQQPTLGFETVGFVDPGQQDPGHQEVTSGEGSTDVLLEPVALGGVELLEQIIAERKPDRLIVTTEQLGLRHAQRLLDLRISGIEIEDASTLYETVFRRISVPNLRAAEMIFSHTYGPRTWTVQLQAIYSFILSLFGVLVTFPLMLLVALVVKLSSPGPALYSQVRVGRHGRPFSLYKFRSMYIDAEKRSGPVWATKNDPRITPVGRWLRLLRLDELPQFFNVLRGEMALVGPRPERPEFCKLLAEKIPFYNQRHFVKPGITGWAQINLKYTDNVEDTQTKLEYDLYYVKHLAPALDLFIIFHTLKVMLLSRGAQ